MSGEEQRFAQQLAGLGLPDDLVEVALHDVPGPAPAALKRIKARAMGRVLVESAAGKAAVGRKAAAGHTAEAGIPAGRNGRRRPFWAAVAAAAVLLASAMGVAAVGPQRVVAAVRQVLAYVPGFGVREAAGIRWAAAGPVRIERDGRSVEVRGATVDAAGVTVHLAARGVPLAFDAISVLHGETALGPARGSIVQGGGTYDAWLFYPDAGMTPVAARRLTVVVRAAGEWRLPVDLVPGAALLPASEFGPAAVAAGYTVAARAQAHADRTELTLLIRGPGAGTVVAGAGRHSSHPDLHRPVTLTAPGWRAEARAEHGRSGDLLYLSAGPPPRGVTTPTLTVPFLAVQEQGEGRVRLPVTTGDVGQKVSLGRWTVEIVRTEVRGNHLRVHVNPGPATGSYLGGFVLEAQAGGRRTPAHQGRLDAATGQVQWLEVAVPAGVGTVTLVLTNPEVTVLGPWVVDVPLQGG